MPPSAYLLPNNGWDPRIHAFQYTTYVTNHAVISDRYVVLIDTLINATTAQVMLDHVKPFLDGTRQLLVINTHSDWDHCWGNQLFAGPNAVHPAPIIGSKLCADDLRQPAAGDLLKRMQAQSPEIFDEVEIVGPTLVFDDRLTIEGGDLTFELFPATGHTHDHIAVYIPEIKTLFAADGAEDPYPEPRKPEFMGQMRQTLAELAALDTDTVLYCHSTCTDASQIHDNIAYFDAIEASVRAAIEAGIALPDAADVDLAALINCTYVDAMPPGDHSETKAYYKTTGHNGNIRNIWLQLTNAS